MSELGRFLMSTKYWIWLVVSLVLWLVISFASGAAPGAPDRHLLELVEAVQRADYAGDRAALRQLEFELEPVAQEAALEIPVRYWQGFALWRRAINGTNEPFDKGDLSSDLQQAIDRFDRLLVRDATSVEAKTAKGSCLLFLAWLNKDRPEELKRLGDQARPLLSEAEAADPNNPRLRWILGGTRWYQPIERGGGQAKAIAIYEQALAWIQDHPQRQSDRLRPSWGKAELLMSLAWSHLNKSEPDTDLALRYGLQALTEVPSWHYVRDILLPQIVAAREQRKAREKELLRRANDPEAEPTAVPKQM